MSHAIAGRKALRQTLAYSPTASGPRLAPRRMRGQRAFTLVELMVVVVLVSVLALLASPSMQAARDDRMVFDYAQRIAALVHRGRARAAARGAAHLFVFDYPGASSQGRGLLFEALDGSDPTTGGPLPVAGCRLQGQWTDATLFAPGRASLTANIVDAVTLDDTAQAGHVFGTLGGPGVATGTRAVALCITPSGVTYFGAGGNVDAAVTAMVTGLPFSGVLQIKLQRRNSSSVGVGLVRDVVVTSGGAPRIKSE